MIPDTNPKTFATVKKISQEATLFGLHYNTFFIFLVCGTVVLLVASGYGISGFIIGMLLTLVFYTLFNVLQVKMGVKKARQYMAAYKTKVKLVKGNRRIFKWLLIK